MRVFRLSREQYKDSLSGIGAALHGQRWNSKGTEVIYTAQSRALATAEMAVHLPVGLLPKDYFMVEIDIPDSLEITLVALKNLPKGWNMIPPGPFKQSFGDVFVKDNKSAVLKVPSVVVQGDFNFILNPHHKDFSKISIVSTSPFLIDSRLIR